MQRISSTSDAYDAFRDAFVPRVEALVVGDPADEDTDVGPLISASERDRVLAWVDEARGRGATILTGGTLEGELVRPTVVERPPADTHLACDEAFGPVCTLQPYDDARRGDRARERDALRPPGGNLHRERRSARSRRPGRSSSAASP